MNYTYGDSQWGDLLTGYGDSTITSDSIGNMTSFGGWTFTWEHGRELASLSKDGTTWTNTYNADGLRTKRTNGSTTYNYVYNGSSLSQMSVGTHLLNFVYDANGAPMAVNYDGVTYYYVTNLQGDVIAILDSTGEAVVEYTYDAWGKLWETTGSMATTLGVHNPLRYRGYVYDPESSHYYLQSRYYDPELGRFINGDAYASTGQGLLGNNMFAYCLNNPIMGSDHTGEVVNALWIARAIHNSVAQRVAKQVNGVEGVYVKKVNSEGKTQRGFLDVYDPKTNSYYEIKSILSANLSRTRRQMEKYDGAEPARNSIGPITRGTAYVSGSFAHGIFDVTYRTEQAGLVTYTATINPKRAANVVVMILLGVGFSAIGGAAGVFIPAFP